jgi:MFS family permease
MSSWLNRTVLGTSVTSLFADIGYEMATAVLPGFAAVLRLPAIAVGLIEGSADLISNLAKLGTGWLGDRLGRRKPFVVAGYALSGSALGLWALAMGWPLLLAGKAIAWFGKGVRGPLRNAILAEAVPAQHRGKAFGLHRAADTVGAVVGPLIGAALIQSLSAYFPDDAAMPYRWIFAFTLIPGLAAALAFAFLVRETPRPPGEVRPGFHAALSQLPSEFRRYLIGVGIFGLGDFARTLLILAAVTLLVPSLGNVGAAGTAALLYAWHNACQALTAFPVGWLSDHVGRRGLLVFGYLLGALMSAAMAAALYFSLSSVSLLALIFCGSGIYVAVEEALEGAMTADLVPNLSIRGTAYGVLGVVNGIGDFVASLVVGSLWYLAPEYGFVYSALVMALGASVLWRVR